MTAGIRSDRRLSRAMLSSFLWNYLIIRDGWKKY
jgi:hypothetical protein